MPDVAAVAPTILEQVLMKTQRSLGQPIALVLTVPFVDPAAEARRQNAGLAHLECTLT